VSEGVRPAWRGASTSTLTVASGSAMSSGWCVLKDLQALFTFNV